MLARLLQLVVLGALLAAALWHGLFRGAVTWMAWAGLGLVPLVHGSILAAEFLLAAFVNRGDPVPRATFVQWVRAWRQELFASIKVFAWWQPFRSGAVPDRWVPSAPGQRGVIFIHGFVCNRGLWTPWLKALQAEGRVGVALNLEPVFGSIDDYVTQVDDAVTRVTAATGLAPVLVCHSMGGLAARAWLRAAGAGADERVRHIVTLGTPHHGTWLARFSLVRNGRQMRHWSVWARQLAADEPPGRAARFTCWYANCDNIVFPASTATLAGADNRLAPGRAHVDLALDPLVMAATLAQIRVLWDEGATPAPAQSIDSQRGRP